MWSKGFRIVNSACANPGNWPKSGFLGTLKRNKMPLVDANFNVVTRVKKCKLNPSLALFKRGQNPKGTPLDCCQNDGFCPKYPFHGFQCNFVQNMKICSANANIIGTL